MENNKGYSFLVWGLIILGIAGILLGMFAVFSGKSGNPSGAPLATISNQINADDHVRGTGNGKVTLIEYSDFQCPACAYFSGQTKQLVADFGDKINFVYRYFPLESIHKYAMLSSQAAEAAGLQGKFWEMGDMLFTNQTKWEASDDAQSIFVSYAAALKLDVKKFTEDLNSASVIARVKKDESDATNIGLQGTPTFFIDGKQIVNPNSYADFKALIQNEINQK